MNLLGSYYRVTGGALNQPRPYPQRIVSDLFRVGARAGMTTGHTHSRHSLEENSVRGTDTIWTSLSGV